MLADVLAIITKILAFIILYLVIGFAPGYYIGILIANRIWGKNNPLRMERHQDTIEQAMQHNKQWHPDDPRWQG